MRARAAMRESDIGALMAVPSARSENRRRSRASGTAVLSSGRKRNGVSAKKIGPRIHGAQVELMPRPQTQQRSRSRCQNQRVASAE
jgi:hypothetical protein